MSSRSRAGTAKKFQKSVGHVQSCCFAYWTYCFLTAAGLAQSVERLTAEQEVVGSIPGAGPTLRVLK